MEGEKPCHIWLNMWQSTNKEGGPIWTKHHQILLQHTHTPLSISKFGKGHVSRGHLSNLPSVTQGSKLPVRPRKAKIFVSMSKISLVSKCRIGFLGHASHPVSIWTKYYSISVPVIFSVSACTSHRRFNMTGLSSCEPRRSQRDGRSNRPRDTMFWCATLFLASEASIPIARGVICRSGFFPHPEEHKFL
jgi:hypothetical protein